MMLNSIIFKGKKVASKEDTAIIKMIITVILATVGTFALYVIAQPAITKIIYADAPEIVLDKLFIIVSIYIILVEVTLMVGYFINPRYLAFEEITSKKWYVLDKNGAKLLELVYKKIFKKILFICLLYTSGYLVVWAIGALISGIFLLGYVASIYVIGLINIVFGILLILTISLGKRKKDNGRISVLIAIPIIITIKSITNYYRNIFNQLEMKSIYEAIIITLPQYVTIVLLITLCLFCIITLICKSAKPSHKLLPEHMEIKDGKEVFIQKESIPKKVGVKSGISTTRSFPKAKNILVWVCTVVCLIISIGTNFVASYFPEDGINIGGYTIHQFQGDTMEPDIHHKDLIFFHDINEKYYPDYNSIVIFTNGNNAKSIARVNYITDNNVYEVDVDNYSDASMQGQLLGYIDESQIDGVYTGKSYLLGIFSWLSDSVVVRIGVTLTSLALLVYLTYKNKKVNI